MSEKCRSCDAPIRWCRTETGKLMPVDTMPVEGGNLELVERTGNSALVRVVEPSLFSEARYVSHFSTCPQSREWRAPAVKDSPTSQAAAAAVTPKIGELHRKVIGMLRRLGPLTDEQIADVLHMNPSTARPRRVELVEAGLVVQDGTGRTKSGRSAARWALNKEKASSNSPPQ